MDKNEQDPKALKPGAMVRGADGTMLVRNHKGELVPLPVPHTVAGERAKLPRKNPDA